MSDVGLNCPPCIGEIGKMTFLGPEKITKYTALLSIGFGVGFGTGNLLVIIFKKFMNPLVIFGFKLASYNSPMILVGCFYLISEWE